MRGLYQLCLQRDYCLPLKALFRDPSEAVERTAMRPVAH